MPDSTRTPSDSSSGVDLRQTATTSSPRAAVCLASSSPIPRLAPVITVVVIDCFLVSVPRDSRGSNRTGPMNLNRRPAADFGQGNDPTPVRVNMRSYGVISTLVGTDLPVGSAGTGARTDCIDAVTLRHQI
jgi:hypothetical protein